MSSWRRNLSERAAVGAALTVLITAQALWMGRAIWGLNIGLVLAYALWASRPELSRATREGMLPLFAAGIAIQATHFTEELWTGFPVAFPAFFGAFWSDLQFAAFNVMWLAAFVVAAVGLGRGVRAASLLVWFFALTGGLANGVAHVGLALARGGYFPGLATAPLSFLVGWLLLRRLLRGEPAAKVDAN